MLVILSPLEYILWHKRQTHINTDFAVTGWMLCVIPHIIKDKQDHSDSDYRKHVKDIIKTFFLDYLRMKCLLLKTHFVLITMTLITIMVNLMGISLYVIENTPDMVTVICGIQNIHFLVPNFLVLFNVESHKRFLILVQQSVLGGGGGV